MEPMQLLAMLLQLGVCQMSPPFQRPDGEQMIIALCPLLIGPNSPGPATPQVPAPREEPS